MLFSCVPQKMSFVRMWEEEKKSYLPRVICVRQVKGKGQFGVISLCLKVSFGRCGRLAGVF